MSTHINQGSTAADVRAAAGLREPTDWRHFQNITKSQYEKLKEKFPTTNSWWDVNAEDQKQILDDTLQILHDRGVAHSVNSVIFNWRMTQLYKTRNPLRKAARANADQEEQPSSSQPPQRSSGRPTAFDPIRQLN